MKNFLHWFSSIWYSYCLARKVQRRQCSSTSPSSYHLSSSPSPLYNLPPVCLSGVCGRKQEQIEIIKVRRMRFVHRGRLHIHCILPHLTLQPRNRAGKWWVVGHACASWEHWEMWFSGLLEKWITRTLEFPRAPNAWILCSSTVEHPIHNIWFPEPV